MRNLILPLALTAGLAFPAAAQWPAPVERQLSQRYNDCMETGDAGMGVTSGMMECSGQEISRQDDRLNQAYRMTMQRLSPARKTKLRADERAWINRRDAGCRREAKVYEGGTAAALNQVQCLLRETIARRLWLEKYR